MMRVLQVTDGPWLAIVPVSTLRWPVSRGKSPLEARFSRVYVVCSGPCGHTDSNEGSAMHSLR